MIHRTANSTATAEMLLSSLDATANVLSGLETPADGWYLVAPYGEWPSPGGEYTQSFQRTQAEEIVQSWNSIAGKAFRVIKNVRHKLQPRLSAPVFDVPAGMPHPDVDHADWRKLTEVARVLDLRTGNAGLEAQIEWDAEGLKRRQPGPLRPSANWWHNAPDASGRVYPAHLESITLTRTPNISGVPAWTANAGGQSDNQTIRQADTDPMNPQQLAALARSLNQPESTAPEKLIELAGIAYQLNTANAAKLQENATALTTANAAKADIESQLTTANGQVTTLTGERDQLKTANSVLVTETDTLRKGVLDLAEKRGIIAPAARADFETRLKTANTASAALTELQTRPPKLNTQRVEIEVAGARRDISTANARAQVWDTEVARRMKDNGGNYDAAVASLRSDPAFAPLLGAMQDPAKQAAA